MLDRFYDWQDAMDADACTRECGAARNDVCVCRCRGQHHNAAHDYWKTWTRQTVDMGNGSTMTISVAPS